jgi:deoxyribose-phosphate aldolase
MTKLSSLDIAQLVDLSAVQANDGDSAIRDLVATARKYHCYLVTALPNQTRLIRDLLGDDPGLLFSGNVGFPSGGQTTAIKVAEANDLIRLGCAELDVMIALGNLISGDERYVLDELAAVVAAARGRPVKVILECHYLSRDDILRGCDLSIQAGAAFVKTGTGWAPTGATRENVALIKSHVGDAIAIKASGGIRSLETLLDLYRLGARRFGIGLRWASQILQQSLDLPGGSIEL